MGKGQLKVWLTVVGSILLVASAALLGGQIFEGTAEPYFWTARHFWGPLRSPSIWPMDLLIIASYLSFYSMGFLIPYTSLSLGLNLFLTSRAEKSGREIQSTGNMAIS